MNRVSTRPAARPRRAARTRAARPPAPPALNSPAHQVLSELEQWWPAFAQGELSAGRRDRPRRRRDERLAVRLATVRAAGLGHPPAAGTLHATDRRALITGRRFRTLREWSLADLHAVEALGNWGGVRLVHPGGDTELIVSAAPERPDWRDASGWLKVEAAFAAGGGRLDEWMAQLPERLALAAAA